jgi:hypothetical protein
MLERGTLVHSFINREEEPVTEYVAETYEEVREKLQTASWELMDEEQRDNLMEKVIVPRWGKVTHDGVVLNDAAWAQALGVNRKLINSRRRRIEARDQGEPASATPAPNQRASIRSARAAIKAHPELAADLLGDPDVAEAIDDASTTLRVAANALHGPAPDPEKVGRQVGSNMARAMGYDAATSSLRSAAGFIIEATIEKEEFGIEHPDEEAEEVARIDRLWAAYKSGGKLTDTDREFLDSIGVKS